MNHGKLSQFLKSRNLLLLLLGVVVIHVAGYGYLISLRRQSRASQQDDRRATVEFAKPIKNSLEDVSGLEKAFQATLSHAPLCKQRNIEKIVYNVHSAVTEMYLVYNDTLHDGRSGPDGKPGSPMQSVHFKKELILAQDQSPGKIAFQEKMEGSPMPPATRILNESGQYTEQATNVFQNAVREAGPRFLATEVSKGSRWKQPIAVDKRLNPGGIVDANVEVLNTFERKGQRFVRYVGEVSFKFYRPALTATGYPSKDKDTEDVVWMRTRELTDLNLDTGIYEDKSTVLVIYYNTIKSTDADKLPDLKLEGSPDGTKPLGLYSVTTVRERLAEVVYRNKAMQ